MKIVGKFALPESVRKSLPDSIPNAEVIVLSHILTCGFNPDGTYLPIDHSHDDTAILRRYYTDTYRTRHLVKHLQRREMIIALDRIGAIFGLSYSDIVREKRHDELTDARQTAAFALRCYRLTHSEIASAVRRDRSTVIYSIEQAMLKIVNDKLFAGRVLRAIAKTESLLKSYRLRDQMNGHGQKQIDWRSLVRYAEDHFKSGTYKGIQSDRRSLVHGEDRFDAEDRDAGRGRGSRGVSDRQ